MRIILKNLKQIPISKTMQILCHTIKVSIISDEECAAQTSDSVTVADFNNECITVESSYEGKISEDMLCAGAPGKDSCQVQCYPNLSVT